MAFEKAKVLKAAEKFLSQGKIPAAIKEYRQIVENDGDDLTALNMLGDLLTRAGESEEAVICFSRIAEHYSDQGFALKAIAMYRKIEKLKPRDPATANKLADLYAGQNLVVDARAQYLVVAEAYTKAGDTKRSLKVLHKIADLDPNNTEIRLRLADGYLKENMQPDAAKAFTEAANRLFENGAFEKSLAAYNRARELRPNDRNVLKGLVSAHTALGAADEAAELLEKAIADGVDDPEIVSMLAQAYIDADDATGAERTVAKIMSEDASNYRSYTEVARLYLKLGQDDDAARILGIISEPMLASREENDLLELVDEVLARTPEQIASLRLLAKIHWWQRDMDKLRSTMERLAESAETAGLIEDERYALTQLVRLAPDEQRFVDRLNALGGSLEQDTEVMDFAEPASAGVPSFESFAIMGDDEQQEAETAAPATPPPADEFEWNSVSEEAQADPSSSFADLNETEAQGNGYAGTAPDSPPVTTESEFELAGEASQPAAVDDGRAQKLEALMQQELESVDFYITQGYADIALDTLELLEKQVGPHAEITLRRKKLEGGGDTAEPAPVAPTPSETITTPPAYEAELESARQVVFGEFDEAALDAGAPVAEAAPPPPPQPQASGIDSGLAEIFEEFRLEAEGEHASSPEDFETHYNMATAYKEMELLDEAIREFQTAAGLAGPAESTSKYFQCCNMLGHCFVQKDMPQAAVIWFKKGLDSPGRSAEEYTALRYELGSAYEQMGDFHRAEGVFTEVYGVDVDYRDVADRLETLRLRKADKKNKKR